MNRLYRFEWLALAFLVIIAIVSWSGALAQSEQQNVTPGLDVVIVLDQSGSMRNTDPTNRRIESIRYIIDYLYFDNTLVEPERTNRVAVIEFGDDAQVLLPFTELKNSEIADEAKSSIVAKVLSSTDGETDVQAALEQTRQLLPAELDSTVVENGGLRKRMLIVVTDGQPQFFCNNSPTPSFRTMFDKCIKPVYLDNGLVATTPMYVIGFNIDEEKWDALEPFWKEIAFFTERIDTVDELNQVIVEQICRVANPESGERACKLQDIGYHFIPPYARTVTFSFFKYQPNTKITLDDPQKKRILPNSDGVDYRFSSNRDETYIIPYPEFGCWKSQRDGAGKADVFTQVILNNLTLTEPKTAHPQPLPLTLKFELRDENGNLVPEYDDLPISFDAKLTSTDFEQPITITKVSDGLYQLTSEIYLPQAGDYILELIGRVDIPPQPNCLSNTETVEVFRSRYSIPVYKPSLVLTSPTPHLQYIPSQILEFVFLDSEGNLIELFDTAPKEIVLEARAPSGIVVPLPNAQRTENTFQIPANQPFVLPETGTYEIIAKIFDDKGNLVFESGLPYIQAINLDVKVPGPYWPVNANVGRVEVQLLDTNNNPVAADPAYPLKMRAFWQDGAGLMEQTELQEVLPNTGLYRAMTDWLVQDVATYELILEGYFVDSSGRESRAFELTYPVQSSDTIPFFKVLHPEQGGYYNLYQGILPIPSPQLAEVQLLLVNQPQIMKDLLVSDPNKTITVTVEGPSGRIALANSALTLSNDGKTLQASFDELRTAGTYTMTFFINNTLRSGEQIDGAWEPIIVSFQRETPWWVIMLWVIVSAAIIGGLAFAIWQWVDNYVLKPRLKGKLFFEYALNQSILTYSLSKLGCNRKRISGKELEPTLGIEYIEVRRVDSGSNAGKTAGGSRPGAPSTENVCIEITIQQRPPAPTQPTKPVNAASPTVPKSTIQKSSVGKEPTMHGAKFAATRLCLTTGNKQIMGLKTFPDGKSYQIRYGE